MVENLVTAVCKLAGIPVPDDKAIVPFLWDRKEQIRVEVEPSTGFIRIFPTPDELEAEFLYVIDYVLKGDETTNCVMMATDGKQTVYGDVWGFETEAPTLKDFAEMCLRLAPLSTTLFLFALAGVPGWEGRLTYRAAA